MSCSVVTKERAVRNQHGDVGVRHDQDAGILRPGNLVHVAWFCGDRRSFTPAGVKEAVKHIDQLGRYPDACLKLHDRNGVAVYVQLEDGRLYASDDPHTAAADGRYVCWADLKKAIKATLKEAK